MPKRNIIFGNAFQYDPASATSPPFQNSGAPLIGQLDKYLSQAEVQAAIRELGEFLELQSDR
jgi:hypothetical protein